MKDDEINHKFLYITVFAGNLLAFTCGVAVSWPSPVLAKLLHDDMADNPLGKPISKDEASWIGSSYSIGGMLGAIGSGYLSNKFGRKKIAIFGAILICASFLVLSSAKIIQAYYVCRCFIGIGCGTVYTIIPMYNSEVAEAKIRGRICTTITCFETCGELVSFCIGPYMKISWYCYTCSSIAATSVLLSCLILPESPYYLVFVNKYEAAEKSLMKLRSASEAQVKEELELLKQFVAEAQSQQNSSLLQILKLRAVRKALLITWGVITFQQLSGIVPIIFYAQTIYESTNTKIPPEYCAMTVGAAEFIPSFIAPAIVDRYGRKVLFYISAIGMALSLTPVGTYFYLLDHGINVDSIFWLPVLCLMTFILAYVIGFGPLPWTIMGEIFPANAKAVAFPLTAAFFGRWLQ